MVLTLREKTVYGGLGQLPVTKLETIPSDVAQLINQYSARIFVYVATAIGKEANITVLGIFSNFDRAFAECVSVKPVAPHVTATRYEVLYLREGESISTARVVAPHDGHPKSLAPDGQLVYIDEECPYKIGVGGARRFRLSLGRVSAHNLAHHSKLESGKLCLNPGGSFPRPRAYTVGHSGEVLQRLQCGIRRRRRRLTRLLFLARSRDLQTADLFPTQQPGSPSSRTDLQATAPDRPAARWR